MLKMKSLILLVVFMISLLTVSAEDINNYDSLGVQVKVEGQLQVVPESSSYTLDYISSELSFFPKNSDFQEVKDEKITSNPDAEIKKGDTILYTWNSYSPELVFGVDSVVNTRTNFNKVNQKVSFPIKEDLSEYRKYIASTSLVNSNDPRIIEKAKEIIGDEDDLFIIVYKIAKWTKENIDYDLETLTIEATQSSVWVLENKRGVCDELTTLFVAMLRSQGIPAKFVTGSSYTNTINDFGNHAWAEVYFPNVGWVAFDPTYGQLGYVDAAHIKMKESSGIKNASINYAWRSRNINLNPKEINIKVTEINKGELVSYNDEISLELLKNQVGPGSKVPLKVSVKNNENFYLPLSVYLTKGPMEIEKNSVELLLKPNSKETTFFIIDVPTNLEEGFTYESELEVKDSYGHKQLVKLEYSRDYDKYLTNESEFSVEHIDDDSEIDFRCIPSKKIYYAYDMQGSINCVISSNNLLNNLEICFENDCRSLDVLSSEEKKVDFNFTLNESVKEGFVTLNGNNISKKSYFVLDVIGDSGVKIINLEYSHDIKYKDRGEIKFRLEPRTEIKSVYVKVGSKEVFSQENLKFKSDFVIPFTGDFFYFNEAAIEVSYKDLNGKDYNIKENLAITVTNTPWYAWVVKFFKF